MPAISGRLRALWKTGPLGPVFFGQLAYVSALVVALTAIAVIGARVSNRSSSMMMYMVLACLAVTAVMTAYSDRVHSEFVRAGFEKLEQFRQQFATAHQG